MLNDGPSGTSQGATIETFAALAAEIAVGAQPLDEVVAQSGFSLNAWHEMTAYFTRLLAFDESGEFVERYARAFAATQDRLVSPPEMSVEAWAELSSDVARRGIAALGEHGINEVVYLRLGRIWAERVAGDRPLAHRYHQAFFAREAVRRR